MGYYSDLSTADLAKLPILQGPENEYGDYDYLAIDIPDDYYNKKVTSKDKWECTCCGKRKHTLYHSCHYFHTLDGWDSLSDAYCKKCAGLDLKSRIKRFRASLKEKRKMLREKRWDKLKGKRDSSKYGAYWHPYYFFEGKYCGPLISKKKLRRVVRQIRKNIWMVRLGRNIDPWHNIDYKKLLK